MTKGTVHVDRYNSDKFSGLNAKKFQSIFRNILLRLQVRSMTFTTSNASTMNTIYCFVYAITYKAEEQTSHITPYLISSMKSNAKSQTVHQTSSTRMSDYVITHFTW